MISLALCALVGFVAAEGITLQLYEEPDCGISFIPGSTIPLIQQTVIANVASVSGNDKDSSGCVAHDFNSTRAIQGDSGFRCNIYSDASCQNFIYTVDGPSSCATQGLEGAGKGILCFSQALFDNPFAESHAEITVGSNVITSNIGGPGMIFTAAKNACTESGCDPTNVLSNGWVHLNKHGQETLSLTGSFHSGNQRDYLVQLINAVISKSVSNQREDRTGSAETDDQILDMFTFYQVVISDLKGNEQARMTATWAVTVEPPKKGDCGIVGTIEKAAFNKIPGVGGVLAQAFDFVCAHSE